MLFSLTLADHMLAAIIDPVRRRQEAEVKLCGMWGDGKEHGFVF